MVSLQGFSTELSQKVYRGGPQDSHSKFTGAVHRTLHGKSTEASTEFSDKSTGAVHRALTICLQGRSTDFSR